MAKQYGFYGRKVSHKKVLRVMKHFQGTISFLSHTPTSRITPAVRSKDGMYYRRWDKTGKVVWMFFPFNLPSTASTRVVEGRGDIINVKAVDSALTGLMESPESNGGLSLTAFDAMPTITDFNPV